MFSELRHQVLFRGLTDEQFARLADHLNEIQFAAGQMVFYQGEVGHNCYIVLEGQIVILSESDGEEVELETLGHGQLFGEMALIDQAPRSASARSLSSTRLAVLGEQQFTILMGSQPTMALELLRAGTERLRNTSRNMIERLEEKNIALERAYHALQAAQHELIRLNRLEEQLDVARRIQAAFLPRTLPQPTGWQIAAYNRGAEAVGGDFYDLIELSHGRLGVVLADVAGKGVPAALFVALARSLLRSATLTYDKRPTAEALVAALEHTNDYLVREHDESSMFITMFYGILDPATGELLYINAGHNPPLLVTPTGVIDELATTGTLPLGVDVGFPYEVGHVLIPPGYALVTFSDGITEAMTTEQELFGEDRLLQVIRTIPTVPAAEMVSAIVGAAKGFVGSAPQADDMTVLVLRRNCP